MPDPQQGISPGRAAWRRLRRNPLAMTGLVVTAVVVLGCTFAPLISGHDPGFQRHWLGALPPGASHPDTLRENRLVPGLPPAVSPRELDATTIELEVDESDYVEWRVVPAGDGTIRRIQGPTGSVDELQVPAEGLARVLTLASGPGLDLSPLVLRVGQRPSVPLDAWPQRSAIISVATEVRAATWRATVADGVVAALERDGEPVAAGVTVPGSAVLELRADGVPVVTSHLLGTDTEGRDLFARILHGGRISLLVGVVATAVSLLIGVGYGALAGYLGGRADRVLMAGVDVLYGLPFMFLVIVLLSFFGQNILLLFAALGAVQWLTMARIVRGQVLGLRHQDFVSAARLAGAPPRAVILRHLVPNSFGPIVVYASLTVPIVILEESFLAFIGLSASFGDGQVHSWGALVKFGIDSLGTGGEFAWLLIWPSAVMAATLIALNVLGDGLRDALDPQLTRGS